MEKGKCKEKLLNWLLANNKNMSDREFSRWAMDLYWDKVEQHEDLDAFTILHTKKFNKNHASQFDARLIKAYSRDENQEKIKRILDQAYKRNFGYNAQNEYGIDEDIYFDDMISSTPKTYQLEKKFFPHDDNFLDSIKCAPKIPVEKWHLIDENDKYKLYSQRLLFKLDEQVMCGEILKKHAKEFNGNTTGSSMIFVANYKGLEDYKFIVDRWDYRPVGQHINFFDSYGKYNVKSEIVTNTQYSHVHANIFRHRSIFGPFVSADIVPTPINEKRKRSELIYEDFEYMADNFLDTFNVFNTRISNKLLSVIPLKELGDNICPSYGVDEHYVIDTPKGFYKTVYDNEVDPNQCLLRLNVSKGEGLIKGKKGRMIELER